MPITSAADLLNVLSKYRILDAAQLAKLTGSLSGGSPDPRVVAKELLNHDWATPYQVNLLLQGRGAELLLGDYLLQQRLGEGGTFKACHLNSKRTVAIKIIRKEQMAHSEAIQRFQGEIRVAAQLDHPHLVRAIDVTGAGDTHFLVTEYVEGGDLQRLVRNSGPLPVGQACTYIWQAALGLQQAAEHGLVHRDIKPSNLLVTADGKRVKILDLGLARLHATDGAAKRASGLARAYPLLGTPDYIAPEQIADPWKVDTRADIYSLGCTFYFLLAGQPPFPDGAWEEKLVCHGKVEPRPIEQVRSNVPPAVGAILRKMMAKWPADRYSAPVEVAQTLTPFCQPSDALPTWAPVSPDRPFAQPIGDVGSAGTLQLSPIIASLPAAPIRPSTQPTLLVSTPPATSTPQSRPTLLVNTPPATPTPQSRPTWVANLPSATPTLMQQPQPQPSKPRPRGRKPSLLMLTGIGVGLVLLVLLVVLAWTKGGGNEPKSAGPGVFIDEDFRSAVANGRLLPDGWEGDAFRVAKDNDACCLESTKPSGLQTVLTKLSDALRGNFFIEGIYHLDNPHQFTITLENRSRSSALAVVFNWDGKVAIDNDPRLAPTNYIPLKPTHFLIRREGKMLRVYLDKVQALQKSLDDAPDFDTLRLGLTAGNGWHQRLARLYLLKAGTTGDEGAASAPTPPPKDKANKKR